MSNVAKSDDAGQSYATAGPCRVASWRNVKLQGTTASDQISAMGSGPEPDRTSQNFTIHLSISRPMGSGVAAWHAPYPVVLLINGFQMRASFYRAYAARLASWGYVCVQYDDPLLRIVDDATELQYFGPIVAWLRRQHEAPTGFLHGILDLDKLAVAGHSRGGKLAGLLYADHPEVGAAVLIDPVDNTRETPEGPRYPSAVRALRAARRPFGMLGAGSTGKCNPEGSNYKAFWGAAANGSWQVVIEQAGHLQFLSAGRLLDPVLRLLCPGGTSSPAAVQKLALPPLVAWLEQTFRPNQTLQRDFQQWTQQQVAAGSVDISVKSDDSSKQQKLGVSDELKQFVE